MSMVDVASDRARQASINQVLAKLKNDNIETVRVMFADQHGILRGKTIVAEALKGAFRSGITATSTLLLKDTSHRTVFPVWQDGLSIGGGHLNGASDVIMVPDPDTFTVLPYRENAAMILCDLAYKNGQPVAFSVRQILQDAISRLAGHNMQMVVGLEVEFHVFEVKDPGLGHDQATMPGKAPKTQNLGRGYQYLTEAEYGRLEAVMDLLRKNAQAMGMPVRSMEVEMGPSQFEFTFDPGAPLEQADRMMMFRTMVKTVCADQGLHATFMARPRIENGAASGWHLHQSVIDAGTKNNLFVPDDDEGITSTASKWIAGILEHAAATCLLTTPTVNGYKRYRPYQLAPDRIQWGIDNRGAMVRAIFGSRDTASRIENRVADPTANPYLYLASQIHCGVSGIEEGMKAPPPALTPYDTDAERLPQSLIAAIDAFEASRMYRAAFGDDVVDYLVTLKRAEWERYLMTVSEWEQDEYFSLY